MAGTKGEMSMLFLEATNNYGTKWNKGNLATGYSFSHLAFSKEFLLRPTHEPCAIYLLTCIWSIPLLFSGAVCEKPTKYEQWLQTWSAKERPWNSVNSGISVLFIDISSLKLDESLAAGKLFH